MLPSRAQTQVFARRSALLALAFLVSAGFIFATSRLAAARTPHTAASATVAVNACTKRAHSTRHRSRKPGRANRSHTRRKPRYVANTGTRSHAAPRCKHVTAPQPAPVPTQPEPAPSVPQPEGASSTPVGKTAPDQSSSCNLFAAPNGSDTTGKGTVSSPYQSVAKLDHALAPGQTGCLRGGTYGSTKTFVSISTNGTAAKRITITSYPGEQATVDGWVEIGGNYTTVAGLQIDGSNTFYIKQSGAQCPTPSVVSQPLVISGANDIFERNNLYQSVASLRASAIGVGFWGKPDNTIIRFNKIHDVGQCTQHDHLIYLASGNNVQIYDNWLYDDHNGFGVTLYWQPTNARIHSNVIVNAGSGINLGDNTGDTVSGNEAWDNVVTNSVRVPSDTGGVLPAVLVMCASLNPGSTGNRVYDNDSFENPDGLEAVTSWITEAQLSVSGNISVNPLFVDAQTHDYALAAGSPVASWGLWNGELAS